MCYSVFLELWPAQQPLKWQMITSIKGQHLQLASNYSRGNKKCNLRAFNPTDSLQLCYSHSPGFRIGLVLENCVVLMMMVIVDS